MNKKPSVEPILIIKHAIFTQSSEPIANTGTSIEEYLQKENRNYYSIKLPLFHEKYILIDSFKNGISSRKKINHIGSENLFVKALFEFIIVLKYSFQFSRNYSIVIGIDPLSLVYALPLKLFQKTHTLIFYTADYAKERFNNKIINYFYHVIDRLALRYADDIWNVSTRITRLRNKQGISPQHNFFVPNAPDFNMIKHLISKKKHDYELITVSTKPFAFNELCNAIDVLKNRYPKIKLIIVGAGIWGESYEKIIKKRRLDEHIIFLNPIPYHALLTMVSQASVGLALYTKEQSWNYYCDSMKARDFLACGVPVIISDITSTSEDIKKYEAGIVLKTITKQTLIHAINSLFKSKSLYNKIKSNALQLAKDRDIKKILDQRLL